LIHAFTAGQDTLSRAEVIPFVAFAGLLLHSPGIVPQKTLFRQATATQAVKRHAAGRRNAPNELPYFRKS
jgi:hypothetical protein